MCGQSTLEESAVDVVHSTSNPIIDLDMDQYPNIEIRSDRVGEDLMYANEARLGETVRFTYSGGSEVGERNVLVVKVGDGFLQGPTLERDGGYRRYLDEYIEDNRSLDQAGPILIVEPFVKHDPVSVGNVKRVRFDDAGEALLASLSGEQLAELYGKYVALEGDGTEFDPQTGEVVVQLPEPVKNRFIDVVDAASSGPILKIERADGATWRLWTYDDGTVGYDAVGNKDAFDEGSANSTPEQVRDSLVKFLA